MDVDAAYYEQHELWGESGDLDRARTELRVRQVAELLPPDLRSLLDVGTGDGRVLEPLRGRLRPGVQIVGLDRSRSAIRHLGLPAILGSADRLPVADRAFDAVTACELLEHLPQQAFDAARRELARVARRTVVITVPNRENLRRAELVCRACGCRYNRRRHLRRFDVASLERLLPGFRLTTASEFGHRPRVYPRVLRQALEERGVISVHDAPCCPQCGFSHPSGTAPAPGLADVESSDSSSYARSKRLAPGGTRPYWLAARLDRA